MMAALAACPHYPYECSRHHGCSRHQVRCGPNYPKYGKKAPSSAALGTVEAMDIFLTQRRISHSLALGHIALPPATPGWSEVYPEFLVITQVSRKQGVPAVGRLGLDLTTYTHYLLTD